MSALADEELAPTKRCVRCGQTRPLVDFQREGRARDGHRSECRACSRAYSRARRNADHDAWLAWNRQYGRAAALRPEDRDRRRAYDQRRRAAGVRPSEAWSKRNPEKRRAQRLLGYAVERGRVIRPDSCQDCGSRGKVEAHHNDYAKPLEVEWLCHRCHMLRQRKYA